MTKNFMWTLLIRIQFFFLQKWSNLHERSGIGWIERKIKFHIFSIFIFRVMVIFGHFCDVITPNNSENKNRNNFLFGFPFYSAHSASSIKIWPLLRKGGGGEVSAYPQLGNTHFGLKFQSKEYVLILFFTHTLFRKTIPLGIFWKVS